MKESGSNGPRIRAPAWMNALELASEGCAYSVAHVGCDLAVLLFNSTGGRVDTGAKMHRCPSVRLVSDHCHNVALVLGRLALLLEGRSQLPVHVKCYTQEGLAMRQRTNDVYGNLILW